MNAHQYFIVPVRASKGTEPQLMEPTVGKWYCEVRLSDDDGNEFAQADYGQLGRYEGEGIFVDEDGEGGYAEVRMDGDYLQEQF